MSSAADPTSGRAGSRDRPSGVSATDHGWPPPRCPGCAGGRPPARRPGPARGGWSARRGAAGRASGHSEGQPETPPLADREPADRTAQVAGVHQPEGVQRLLLGPLPRAPRSRPAPPCGPGRGTTRPAGGRPRCAPRRSRAAVGREPAGEHAEQRRLAEPFGPDTSRCSPAARSSAVEAQPSRDLESRTSTAGPGAGVASAAREGQRRGVACGPVALGDLETSLGVLSAGATGPLDPGTLEGVDELVVVARAAVVRDRAECPTASPLAAGQLLLLLGVGLLPATARGRPVLR